MATPSGSKKRTTTAKRIAKATPKKPAKTTPKKPKPKSSKSKTRELNFKLLGCSDAAVRKATGHNWTHWIAVLKKFDVNARGHAPAAEHLHTKHGVAGWWSQMIVVGYERHRGLRAIGQTPSGFSASASRTIDAPAQAVFDWLDNATRAARWLPKGVKVHKSTRPKSARMTWTDGSKVLSVWIGEKKSESPLIKSSVQIQHDKLPDAASAASAKKVWSDSLNRLSRLCRPAR